MGSGFHGTSWDISALLLSINCLDTLSSERGRLIVKVKWKREGDGGRERLPKVAKGKRPEANGSKGEGGREGGIHPIILTRKKVAEGNKMDCGDTSGQIFFVLKKTSRSEPIAPLKSSLRKLHMIRISERSDQGLKSWHFTV